MSVLKLRRFPKLAKEPLLTSRIKANPENRCQAKVVDIVVVQLIVLLAGIVVPWSHVIVNFLAWGFLERTGRGQSPGKWLLGLHAIEGNIGRKPVFFQSFVRNLPFFMLVLGWAFHGWAQWIILAPALAWIGLETYFIFTLRSGIRIGDIFANTRVYDYKDEHTQFIEQFLKEDSHESEA
jgi:uncharacterized RDD family membrane protein YckC